MLRDLPWACPWHRAAPRPERVALQHGFCDRDRLPACGRHRHRHGLPAAPGAAVPSRGGHGGGSRGCVLPVAGVRLRAACGLRERPRATASLRARALPLLAMALECRSAQAHLESTGMGPVYDGVLHFLTSPEDLVPALALAMLAGLRGATYAKQAMFTLPVAWLL